MPFSYLALFIVVVLLLLVVVFLLPASERPPSTAYPKMGLDPEILEAAHSPKWDPYDVNQSQVHRIRAARRRKRPPLSSLDYYTLLGLDRGATDVQIEQAYRKHVGTIHPDRYFGDPKKRGEAERKLKQLNAVMLVLRDPTRRAQYDANLETKVN